jgi:hypothetical protein
MLFSRCHDLPEPNLKNLNYKRGLQRVYVVASVIWIVVWLALAIRYRPVPDIFDAAEAAAPTGPQSFSEFVAGKPEASPPAARTPKSFTPDTLPADFFDAVAAANHTTVRRDYWISRGALIALPPVACYLAFFVTVPWVARGFRKDG